MTKRVARPKLRNASIIGTAKSRQVSEPSASVSLGTFLVAHAVAETRLDGVRHRF